MIEDDNAAYMRVVSAKTGQDGFSGNDHGDPADILPAADYLVTTGDHDMDDGHALQFQGLLQGALADSDNHRRTVLHEPLGPILVVCCRIQHHLVNSEGQQGFRSLPAGDGIQRREHAFGCLVVRL
ncbi:MAG: hypothetical protein ACD_75C02319G0002 [uncultured bacterium]|nr:MAG: hypothetical protein ACD_75C02319G0002 [uncultured bacterium]